MRSADRTGRAWWVIVAAVFVAGALTAYLTNPTAPPPDRESSGNPPRAAIPAEASAKPATRPPARGPLTLEGRVRHADGRPFVGRLMIAEDPLRTPWSGSTRRTMGLVVRGPVERHTVSIDTDRAGRFSCPDLRAGTVAVSCEVEGVFRPLAEHLSVPYPGSLELDIPNPADVHTVAVELEKTSVTPPVVGPGVVIEGRVQNEQSGPVAGATVLVGALGETNPGEPVRTVSAADGSFRFSALVPGRNYWLAAEAPGRKPRQVGPLRGAPGETCTARLTLDVAFELELRVLAEDRPVHGAEVVLLAEESKSHRERVWLTDDTGTARLDGLPDGPVWLDVRHPEHPPLEPLIHLSGERVPGPLTVRLEKGHAIEGRVLSDDPEAVITGIVNVDQLRKTYGVLHPHHFRRSAVQRDGRFRISGLLPGEEIVFAEVRVNGVRHSGGIRAATGTKDAVIRVEVADPAPADAPEVEVAPRRANPIRIEVKDQKGTPVPGVRVSTRKPGEIVVDRFADDTFTGPDGMALLHGSKPGLDYALEITPPTARRELVPMRLSYWRAADGTIRLDAGLYVRGRIDDAEKLGLDHAVVVAEWPDGDLTAVPFHDGTFEIGPLPDRRLSVWAMPDHLAPSDWIGPKAVTLPGVEGLIIPWGRLLPLRVRLINLDALHWKDSAFVVSEQTGNVLEGKIEREMITFSDLPATESFTLMARLYGAGLCTHWPDLRPNEGEYAIALAEGRNVTGRLLLPREARSPRVFAHRGAVFFAGEVENDGRFLIRGLPEGTWDLRVTFKAGKLDLARWAEATTDVPVEIDVR